MNIFKKWFDSIKKKISRGRQDGFSDEEERFLPLRRDKLDIDDFDEREQYIRSCCEQMIEANSEVDRSTMEYRVVTDYLMDIEEIENAPYQSKRDAIEIAQRIVNLERDSAASTKQVGKISEEEYRLLDKYSADIEAELSRMKENEEYKLKVRTDLRTLESEKAVTDYKVNELTANIANARNMVAITITATVIAIAILIFLQFGMGLDTVSGYVVAAALCAIALTMEFLQFKNYTRELKRARRYLNQVITRQNTVKIRYVNITNLLEYEYAKYHVSTAAELEYFREKYLEEKRAREVLGRAEGELSNQRRRLIEALKELRLKDPGIWVRQCRALIDPKEMVEIRHELRIRRENLRTRIEYNTKNREDAKNEINDIVHRYPKYAREVLDIVSGYE
ncbi:MAG: hypothetical protein J6O71_06950 [Lachnospiraceae bacterium]|nr:hypothetical protein [Lachnospiraceae bacterium]